MNRLTLLPLAAALLVSTANAASLGDMADLQYDIDRAELQNKLDKARKTEKSTSPTVVKQDDATVILKGVYGLGSKLNAAVSIDGAEVVYAVGDTFLGYKAKSIAQNEVILVKVDKHGRAGKQLQLQITGGGGSDGAARGFAPLPGVPGAMPPPHPAGVMSPAVQ